MAYKITLRRSAVPVLASVSLLVGAAAVAMPAFGDWSAPANLETLAGSSLAINTPAVDGCASQSQDGLMLAFNSSRAGNQEIFIAERPNTSVGFGDPVKLPAAINTAAIEFCPTLLPGKRMIFSSAREDPNGDLYETRLGPKGWSQPSNLGPNINSSMMDESAAIYEDEDGNEVMLFCRRNPDGTGGKIYQSINRAPASVVGGGVHSSASDCRPSVTHDGKTMFFDSTRSGGLGGPDLYSSTRSSTSAEWGTAIHLQQLSSPAFDARPSISWDGTMMTFSSARSGSESPAPDIWFAERVKASGN